MTKFEQARQLITKNPKISPADMSAEMGVSLSHVYILRSQVKKAMGKPMRKKAKSRSLVSSSPKTTQQIVIEHNEKVAGIQGWDDEPVEGPANWKNIRVEASPAMADKLEKINNPTSPLLAKMDRLREELADARAVIRYLEKRLEGK